MKRYLIFTIFLLIALLSMNNTVYAKEKNDTLEDNIDRTLDKIDFGDFDSFLEENIEDRELFGTTLKEYLKGIIKGDMRLGIGEVMNVSMKYLFRDFMRFVPLIITVLSISILFSIVSGMSSHFKSKSTNEIIYFVCYIAIIVSTITSIGLMVSEVSKVVNAMHRFMEIIFPVLLTLMAGLGGVITVSSYQPLMSALTYLISSIVTKIIMPIFIASIVFAIIGNLSHGIKLEKMTKSLKSVGEYILGFIFSIFASFVTIQGIAGSSIDNISIKSAKFAISSYVPILGGYLSDGFDLVLASGVLIKNALGIVGIVVIALLTLAPLIKIIVFTLTLKITAGIIEPISDSRLSDFVYAVSENMGLLVAILLGVAFMFFITCMLVILSLNAVV